MHAFSTVFLPQVLPIVLELYLPMPTNFKHSSSDAALETPLLDDTVKDAVDCEGRPALRSKSGGWRSAGFIIG